MLRRKVSNNAYAWITEHTMRIYSLPWREYARMNLLNQWVDTQKNDCRIPSNFIGGLQYGINNDSVCARKITKNTFNKYIKFWNKVHFVLVILVKTSSWRAWECLWLWKLLAMDYESLLDSGTEAKGSSRFMQYHLWNCCKKYWLWLIEEKLLNYHYREYCETMKRRNWNLV